MGIYTHIAFSQQPVNALPDTGYVGVGTTNPSCPLEVIGNTTLNGRVTIDSSLAVGDSLSVQENVRIKGNLFVEKNLYVWESIQSDSLYTNKFSIGKLHILDSLKVGTNTLIIGGLDHNLLNNHIYADDGYLQLQSQLDQFPYVHSPTRNLITNVNSGRMGIGTTNPQTKLHVKGIQCNDCGGPPPVETTFISIEDEIVNSQGNVVSNTTWRVAATATQDRFFINKPGMLTNVFTITADSKVGIGTHTPAGKLHVAGGNAIFNDKVGIGTTNPGLNYGDPSKLSLDVNGDARFFRENNTNNYIRIGYNTANAIIDNFGQGQLLINYYSEKNVVIGDGQTPQKSNLTVNGHVGINASADPNTALYVCGTIKSKEVIVDAVWCDYVFEEDYKRMTQKEKADYFKEYKHLPKIAPGKEIEENGLKVAETMQGFVYNLETLSLDQIELYEIVQELKKENAELKEELKTIKIYLSEKPGKRKRSKPKTY